MLDAADHIRPIGGLGVPGPLGGQLRPVGAVVQLDHHRGGAQVHRRRQARPARLTGGRGEGVPQDHPGDRLGQGHLLPTPGKYFAGQPRPAVHLHPALAAPAPAPTGRREGEARPPQGGQQALPGLDGDVIDFLPLPDLDP